MGLSRAGKTTIGRELYRQWKAKESNTVLIDGDEIRAIFQHDVDEFSYATLKYKNGIISEVGAAIRLNMKNITLITGTKGKILVNNPWLPDKKAFVDIETDKGNYKWYRSHRCLHWSRFAR